MANRKLSTNKNHHQHTQGTYQTLVSTIRSSQGLKLPVLKSLYYLLTHFSSNETMTRSNDGATLDYLNLEFNQNGLTVKFKEIRDLSDILFEQLDSRFKQIYDAFEDVSANQANGQAVSHSNSWASFEELILILRCCMVILSLLIPDQLMEKGQVLLSVLRRLINSSNADDDCCTVPIAEGFASSICSSGPSDPTPKHNCALLQVFADELLMHKSLRTYFMLIDSASSTSEMLFTCHFGQGDIGSVLEVIAAHFIISVSNEQAFENLHNKLLWQHDKDFRVCEMSLTASLSLLLNPIILSAPKIFQAYLILLVSEAIGIRMCSEHMKPDARIMDCYLTAFQKSIVLYTRHMSDLQMDGHPIGSNKSCMLGSSQLSFESYIQPATRNQIHRLITKLDDSWDSFWKSISIRTKSDLVDASIAYVKESLHVFDISYKDDILAILTSVIHRSSSNDICDIVLYKEGRSPQDMYLLASILKLMSSSMLQTTWCLRRCSSSGCLKTLEDVVLYKEYNFLVHLIGCFRQFNNHLPIQKFVFDILKTHTTRHEESKWMLLQFSGLLSLSHVSGLDFLAKDCIFMIMSLLNLFVFEEGDLDSLSSLFISRFRSFSSRSSDRGGEAFVNRKSSKTIAIKFQKMQTLHLSKRSFISFHEENNRKQTGNLENDSILNDGKSDIDREEEIGKGCNGEIFLKCVLKGSEKSSDLDDLADFIECKQSKDYSVWLKDREKFRMRKTQRLAVDRWEKHKRKPKLKRK
ncbi:hypothetical protein Dsin_001834 [Dipteronia sinensis]|uniref:DUF7812 domain-containing protein n=1 Tax=Dipteronia sinensis TaxID=43782 RepID=A0AAE0B5I5_9ROSI|nr:hypothetical protein Dsin_001834 [Dipteronia sinensis]